MLQLATGAVKSTKANVARITQFGWFVTIGINFGATGNRTQEGRQSPTINSWRDLWAGNLRWILSVKKTVLAEARTPPCRSIVCTVRITGTSYMLSAPSWGGRRVMKFENMLQSMVFVSVVTGIQRDWCRFRVNFVERMSKGVPRTTGSVFVKWSINFSCIYSKCWTTPSQ